MDNSNHVTLYFFSKMAVAMSIVVCDVLCYLRNKYDKLPVKILKSSLADFYNAEVLSDAKKQ